MAFFVLAFVIRKKHHVWRWIAFAMGFVFVVVTIGAGINSHYSYYQTLGSLWGDIGVKQVSSDDLKPLPKPNGTDPGQAKPKGCDTIPAEGTQTNVKMPGTKSGFQGPDVVVYLPPAWCTNDDTQYPVLFLLHGTPSPGGAYDWFTAMEANKYTDAFAAQHDGKAPILIVPDVGSPSDTECVDSPKYGNIETYVTQDVVDFVKNWDVLQGRIKTDAKGWGVAGFSMGGTCSIMLALRHPDLWTTFGDYGGDLFGTGSGVNAAEERQVTSRDLWNGNTQIFDEHDPAKLLASGQFPGLGGYFGAGAKDQGTFHDLQGYYELAKKAGIATCWLTTPDQDHTFAAWRPTYEASLPWFSARMGLIPDTPAIQQACKQL